MKNIEYWIFNIYFYRMLTPTEIKQLCYEYRLSPSKHYGQHYLISEKPIDAMIRAADLSQHDTVIEIGPGFGVLTFALAPLVKKVVAFEIEKKLASYWEEKKKEFSNVDVIFGNALYQLPSVIAQLSSYKLVANLPYQITSDIFRMFLDAEHKPKTMVVMVQKEVADRIVAKPGNMSMLSVAVQYYGTPSIISKVPKGAFWPAPKVDSAVLHIDLGVKAGKPASRQADKKFFDLVRVGFSNKRKQLWNNLSHGLGIDGGLVKQAIASAGLLPTARAQELAIEEWIRLRDILNIEYCPP